MYALHKLQIIRLNANSQMQRVISGNRLATNPLSACKEIKTFSLPRSFNIQIHEANEVASAEEIRNNETISIGIAGKMFSQSEINGCTMKFLLNACKTCSLINLLVYSFMRSLDSVLKTFSGAQINLKGNTMEHKKPPLVIVSSWKPPNLFAVESFNAFSLNISANKSLIANMDHESPFKADLGTSKTYKLVLKLKMESTQKCFKYKAIPFPMMGNAKEEIETLTKESIWKIVKSTERATQVVVAPKPVGSMRICGDFRVTENPQPEKDQYLSPRPEELFQRTSEMTNVL
ncbi:uncharacterized protein LOC126355368 [Schistocerca gregaria]|uniref:uncharacterized protein LOC126355368 n=1 Tax=Schistocerca gregaria TaxID=7010 RepID=UPI00211DACAF|nr:uncharacterized protein LOC126355368 [Schistocerca gregaria]